MMYDVTMRINNNMQVYKNKEEKKPIIKHDTKKQPHFTSETILKFNMHTGTHLDFPKHMIENGLLSTNFNPGTFVNRKVKVFELSHLNEKIEVRDIEKFSILKDDIIFFKTKNSEYEYFLSDFIYLSSDAAKFLSDRQIFAVGIDALGIERKDPDHKTHKILMSSSIWIIEGLRLKGIKQKEYNLIATPLLVDNSDALPLTVLLYD